MRTRRLWAVVADGSRARIVRDIDAKDDNSPRGEIMLEADHKRLGEIMADKPGRAFSSVGTRRSSMEYASDPVRDEAKLFAGEISHLLDEYRVAGEFDSLFVYAAPQMLGFLRAAMAGPLKALVVAEIPKDLTKLPDIQLRKVVADEARAHPAPLR